MCEHGTGPCGSKNSQCVCTGTIQCQTDKSETLTNEKPHHELSDGLFSENHLEYLIAEPTDDEARKYGRESKALIAYESTNKYDAEKNAEK